MNNTQQNYGWSDTELTEANQMLIPKIVSMVSIEAAKTLDLGCGNGTLSAALHQKGVQVVGVDASSDGVELASSKFPGVKFETCSIYEDSFGDIVGQGFDYVISMEVVEHLYWPRKLLEKAYESLAPGGEVIITTPYHGYFKNLAISLLNGWYKHFTVDWDGGHIKFFSENTLTGFMQDAGFKDIQFRGVGRAPYLWKSMILSGKK